MLFPQTLSIERHIQLATHKRYRTISNNFGALVRFNFLIARWHRVVAFSGLVIRTISSRHHGNSNALLGAGGRIGIGSESITVKDDESRMEGRLMSLAQLPLRLTTGAFVLNSGIGKLSISDEEAEGLQQMAANGVPVLADMSPAAFRRVIAATEISVGAAQLIPKVPGWLAGSALSAFSAGLLNMYLNTPGMTQDDG